MVFNLDTFAARFAACKGNLLLRQRGRLSNIVLVAEVCSKENVPRSVTASSAYRRP